MEDVAGVAIGRPVAVGFFEAAIPGRFLLAAAAFAAARAASRAALEASLAAVAASDAFLAACCAFCSASFAAWVAASLAGKLDSASGVGVAVGDGVGDSNVIGAGAGPRSAARLQAPATPSATAANHVTTIRWRDANVGPPQPSRSGR